jgi:hypothetical protein
MATQVVPVRKGTLAARVDELEEKFARMRALCGEVLATLADPAYKDDRLETLLSRRGEVWSADFQKLCN